MQACRAEFNARVMKTEAGRTNSEAGRTKLQVGAMTVVVAHHIWIGTPIRVLTVTLDRTLQHCVTPVPILSSRGFCRY